MKKAIKAFFIGTLLAGLFSCAKISDEPFDFNQHDVVYSDSLFIRHYINALYNYIPHGYNRLGNAMLDASTDLAVNSRNNSPAFRIGTGAWGPSNNPDDAWNNNYRGIRAVNIFFRDIEPNIDPRVISDQEYLNALRGQGYFLRALFYSELVKRYGGVPIFEDVFDGDDEMTLSRENYDDAIAYIVAQCDSAAAYLPVRYSDNNASDFGRATKGAAMALKARMLLYAASPLFNDPSESNGSPWKGAYDASRWEAAADAAYQVIALDEYELFESYKHFFITIGPENREMIFNRVTEPHNNIERLNGPTGITGGQGATNPSLNLVESYMMADGTNFSWDNPVHAANPFGFREARFSQSILWNGSSWMGHSVQTFEGGADMQSILSTKTGFYMRKLKDQNARWFGGQQGVGYHCWPIIRYAEVLLNFAEAMNEAYGPYADPAGYGLTAAMAVNKIRQRAFLPPNTIPTDLAKDEMRRLIHRERKIEMAFEEHRTFDLRRWKTAMEVLNEPVRGLRIIKNTDGSFTYEIKDVESRTFSERMYLYPIPQIEINKNPQLIQNPGW